MGISSINGVTAGTQGYTGAGSSSDVVRVEPIQTFSQDSDQKHVMLQDEAGTVALTSGDAGEDLSTTLNDMKEISKLVNDQTVAEFGYNEPTHRITITIKDKETGDVIKEIPSDKILKMVAKAWEIAGIMVDEKR